MQGFEPELRELCILSMLGSYSGTLAGALLVRYLLSRLNIAT